MSTAFIQELQPHIDAEKINQSLSSSFTQSCENVIEIAQLCTVEYEKAEEKDLKNVMKIISGCYTLLCSLISSYTLTDDIETLALLSACKNDLGAFMADYLSK
jgi:hypothetical protein